MVTIINVRIRYGRDSLELSQTEFSKVIIPNYTKNTVNVTELIRYEYPAQKMSLREMLDTGMVALPTVTITHTEDRQTEEGKKYLIVYLYDSTALVRLYLFDESVIEVFRGISKHKRFRILSGIYKKTMKFDPKYATALPIANLRVKEVLVELTDEYYELTIILLKNICDITQPVVTEGILKEKEEVKTFYSRDGSVGYKMTFTIDQEGDINKITTFSKRDVDYLLNISEEDEIRVWWVSLRKNKYIVQNHGYLSLV